MSLFVLVLSWILSDWPVSFMLQSHKSLKIFLNRRFKKKNKTKQRKSPQMTADFCDCDKPSEHLDIREEETTAPRDVRKLPHS